MCVLGDKKIFAEIDNLCINLFAFLSLVAVFMFGRCVSVASQITGSSMELFFGHCEEGPGRS